MKLMGALMVIWAGALLGCAAAARLDARVRRIRLLRQWLTALTAELRQALPLISDLLKKTAAHPAFGSLIFLQTAAARAEMFPDCWDAALAQDNTLTPAERTVLETVGQTLGSSALEGQLASLALCQERLSALQDDAEQLARSKGRLCRSVGLLGGIFLAILLI